MRHFVQVNHQESVPVEIAIYSNNVFIDVRSVPVVSKFSLPGRRHPDRKPVLFPKPETITIGGRREVRI